MRIANAIVVLDGDACQKQLERDKPRMNADYVDKNERASFVCSDPHLSA